MGSTQLTREIAAKIMCAMAPLCLWSCADESDPHEEVDVGMAERAQEEMHVHGNMVNASSTGFDVLYLSHGFSQGLAWGEAWDEDDPKKVALQEVYAPARAGGGYERYAYEFGTALTVVSCGPQGLNSFLVLGLSSFNEVVIEEWTIGCDSIGDAPGPGTARMATRREKYRGPGISDVRALGADPYRPGAMVLAGIPLTLYWVDFQGGPPVALFDAVAHPWLSKSNIIYPRLHATEGLLWIAAGAGDATVVVFKDANSDGNVEFFVGLTIDEWEAVGWNNDVWLDDFDGD
ncbi:MAG: hypothetical protein ACI82F_004596 [Planctomycetota bacterium]|jgi:hypothetical protein